MSTHTPPSTSRPLGVVISLVVAVSLVFSAVAAATPSGVAGKRAKTKVTVLSKSPERVTAGQNFTVTFAIVKPDGTRVPYKSFDCFARTAKRYPPLVSKSGDGEVASCTWSIPAAASGEALSGMLGAPAADGKTYFLGFDNWPIG